MGGDRPVHLVRFLNLSHKEYVKLASVTCRQLAFLIPQHFCSAVSNYNVFFIYFRESNSLKRTHEFINDNLLKIFTILKYYFFKFVRQTIETEGG